MTATEHTLPTAATGADYVLTHFAAFADPEGFWHSICSHLDEWRDQPAIIWTSDRPRRGRTLSFDELYAEVCHLAAGLQALGVSRGDRVAIYLPAIPEATVAALACVHLGAAQSLVLSGDTPEALACRLANCAPRVIITADEAIHLGLSIPLKQNVDTALRVHDIPSVRSVIMVCHTGADTGWVPGRDSVYDDVLIRGWSGYTPPAAKPLPAEGASAALQDSPRAA